MTDFKQARQAFEDRLMGVVEQMAQDKVPDAQIRKFIEEEKAAWGQEQNAARSASLDQVSNEGGLGAAVNRGLHEWAGNWGDRLVAMARGARKLGSVAMSPRESLQYPEQRREFGRGLSDVLGGLPAWLGDKAGVTDYAGTAAHDVAQPETANLRGAGSAAGMVAMLPAGAAGARVLAALPGSTAAKALLAPMATGTAMSTVHAALDPEEHVLPRQMPDGTIDQGALLSGLTDPMNIAVPAAMGAASKVGQVLRSNPTIGRFARARQAGAYEQPEMRALPRGQEGMQRAAEQGLERIVARDRQLADQAGQQYQAAIEPELDRPVDTERLRMRLLEGRQANVDPDSGLPIRPEVDRAYNQAFDRTPEQATIRGTLMRRRGLQQDAAFGSANPTEAQAANRSVYQTFRQGVREASPAVAAADDAYTAHSRQASRRRDILFNTEENVVPSGGGGGYPDAHVIDADPGAPAGAAAALQGPPDLRVSKARSAATTLGRVDDTNVPGLRAARFLQELAAQDPEFATAIEFIANKKALEGTRFSLEGLKPTSLHGATAVGGLMPLIEQNARALGARVLEPAARTAGGINPGTLQVNPVLQAYAAQKERERRAAELLTGGRR